MEPDEMKAAWQMLDQRLQQQHRVQWQLLRETRLDKARASLRPLIYAQLLQMLLGLGLVGLGVACWTRNTEVTGLLIAGALVHAFGLLHVICGGITLALIGTVNYDATVLDIQKQMARLLRFQEWNSAACGLPWWIFWVLVVVAFAGLGEPRPDHGTAMWIWLSLAVGVAGLIATWIFGHRAMTGQSKLYPRISDGADGIRRSQRILDEIAAFERE